MVLLVFFLSFSVWAKEYRFPAEFEFGVSNASAQVEDQLDDAWMQFARQGATKAFLNTPYPEQKLKFWSQPEIEIELAHKLGVKVFRMSLDWQRLYPKKGQLNQQALARYQEICRLIKAKGMKVMMTHFHHSLPDWAIALGGWPEASLIAEFVEFAEQTSRFLKDDVDYWISFNEPNVFALFTYAAGIWPPGKKDWLALVNFSFYQGAFFKAMKHMAQAHNLYYQKVKPLGLTIGIAHNTANYKGSGWLNQMAVDWSWQYMNYLFPDLVQEHLDFMGFNYYGAEFMSGFGIEFHPTAHYNDAGRAIDPQGLYFMLKHFYKRYKLPLYITENGTADEMDFFRGAYIIEHLLAIHQAIAENIPVLGYIQWSLTDNFEWSDGYCPKFGLVAVDRQQELKRLPRDSFFLYQELAKTKRITAAMREKAWKKVQDQNGKPRLLCRHQNAQDALDKPRTEIFKYIDWRFTPASLSL